MKTFEQWLEDQEPELTQEVLGTIRKKLGEFGKKQDDFENWVMDDEEDEEPKSKSNPKTTVKKSKKK